MNCEKGEGIGIAKKYGIRAYPSFVVVNGQGEITDRWVGYGGPEAWSQAVEMAKSDTRTVVAKKAAFDTAPDAHLAECLGNDAAAEFDYKTAVDYFRQARAMNSARASDFTEQILTNMFYGSRAKVFSFEDVAGEADLALKLPQATQDRKEELASMLVSMARSLETPEKAVPYIKAALAADIGDAEPSSTRQGLMVEKALLIDHDGDRAVSLRKGLLPEGWQDDPDQLNSFAWWCFQNGLNLDEAEKLALHGAEVAGDDASRANILDTAAEICAARGHLQDAVKHAKRAAELDPDKEYFQQQVERFTKEAAGS